jgi:hypothetical protein
VATEVFNALLQEVPMRIRSIARVSGFVSSLALSAAAFAQSTPATPTTATALAQSIDLSDAKSSGLLIVAALVSLGVVLWGARLILNHFRPK